jgi:hypothetical protein
MIAMMASYGMQGVVLKSQMLPTVTEANLLNDLFDNFHVFGGTTLNITVGGLSPVMAQLSAEMGGKVIWMPTWSSKNDLSYGKVYLNRMIEYVTLLKDCGIEPENGLVLYNQSRKLLPEVEAIVRICSEYQMVLASGHVSPDESVVLSEMTRKAGIPLLLNHPLSRSVGASIEQQKQIVANGAFIEHVFVTAMPMHQSLHPRKMAEAIKEVGAEHCILGTDAIYHWNPPAPELLHMFIASLLHLGVTEDDIRLMVYTNPRKLLGIEY